MLSSQVSALTDSFIKLYDNQHPLPYLEREARAHIRHGQRIGSPVQWEASLDQGDFVQMGRFMNQRFGERADYVWSKLQEAIGATEIDYYPELSADIELYLADASKKHVELITAILNELGHTYQVGSGYVSEILRELSLVPLKIEADVALFCAKHEANTKRKAAGTITYNLSGPNSRMMVNSHDYSVNIADSRGLFEQILKAINENVANPEQRAELASKTDELQQSIGKPSFKEAYHKWISIAADHAQLITFAPWICELVKTLAK